MIATRLRTLRLPRLAGERPASVVLGFVAGFIDIAGYLTLSGLFSANMTGNILLAAVALVRPRDDIALSRVLAVPLFMLGIALGVVLAAVAKRRGWPAASVLLLGEALALALFMAAGAAIAPRLQAGSTPGLILAIGVCSLIAMGLQNVLTRELFPDMPATTGMTSNLAVFVLDGAELLSARLQGRPSAPTALMRRRYTRVVAVLGGFVLGAMAGALGMRVLEWWSVLLPVALAGLLALAVRGTSNTPILPRIRRRTPAAPARNTRPRRGPSAQRAFHRALRRSRATNRPRPQHVGSAT